MWRNVITSSDETKVDIKRPTTHRAAPTTTRPPFMLSSDPAREETTAPAPIGRVPWPEPPRRRREHPWTKTDGIALSRTLAGSGHLSPFSSWCGQLAALSAVAIIGFFLVRAPRHVSIGSTAAPSPAVESPLLPAPLAPPSPTAVPAAPTLPAALPRSTKPPIAVSSLPVAPPERAAQPRRNKRSTAKQFARPLARPARAPSTTVSAPPPRPPSATPPGSAGDDGF